jgi:hypothetical protein
MNTNTTTTTTATDAVMPFLDAHLCGDCGVYRVDVLFDGDLCDDCCDVTADDEANMRDCSNDCTTDAPCNACHVDGPTVDFHE